MSAQGDDLPASARRVLGEYRAVRRMPRDAFDRVQRRLLRRAAPPWSIAVVAAAAAAVTVFALSTLSGTRTVAEGGASERPLAQDAAQRDASGGELAQPQPHRDIDAAVLPATPAPMEPTGSADAADDRAAPNDPARSSRRPPSPTPPGSSSPPSTLAAERTLLAQAQRAVADGDHDRAAAILRRHAEQFPQGALRPEFAALDAMLRCRDPGQSQAAVLADFTAAHANSPLIAAVRRVCGDR